MIPVKYAQNLQMTKVSCPGEKILPESHPSCDKGISWSPI